MGRISEADAKAKKIKKVKAILVELGITMSVDGCGCCGSPVVSFSYNGQNIVKSESNFIFDTNN